MNCVHQVAAARKFSAEKYVNDYLEDFHKELLPKTYQGHRLPEWLIKVISDCARGLSYFQKLSFLCDIGGWSVFSGGDL